MSVYTHIHTLAKKCLKGTTFWHVCTVAPIFTASTQSKCNHHILLFSLCDMFKQLTVLSASLAVPYFLHLYCKCQGITFPVPLSLNREIPLLLY